jgi:hypothetical protein
MVYLEPIKTNIITKKEDFCVTRLLGLNNGLFMIFRERGGKQVAHFLNLYIYIFFFSNKLYVTECKNYFCPRIFIKEDSLLTICFDAMSFFF